MSKVLYIQASPRGKRSKSITVADAFAGSYRESHAGDEVEVLNIFEADLPAFDGLAVQAKYTILNGKEHSAEELEAWKAVEQVIEKFKSAEKYVLAVPMWNFNIPYRLKQYLDIILQPGYTFSFSPEEGYKGLILGKPVLVVYARGGAYSEPGAAAMNHQSPYLEMILGFMGFTEIQSLAVEPTLMGGPEVAQQVLAEAVEKAKSLAKEF